MVTPIMEGSIISQGAELTAHGVRYRVWAPRSRRAVTCVWPAGTNLDAPPREVILDPTDGGYHSGVDAGGRAGDRYMIRLDKGTLLPCPASRFQPSDVSGPALV